MTTLTDQETVVCAFCKGLGTDPYDQLSSLSKCGACDGTGTKRVVTPHTPCVFCRGTGSYKVFRCLVCGGAGVVPMLDGPTETCAACEGTAVDASSGMPCVDCRGRGLTLVTKDEKGSHHRGGSI
jgi:DnaJ-class molecular chaperone